MERKASTARSDLERMLVDETAEPKALPLSLLEDITGDFSDDQEIGSGGFAVVYKGILGDRAVAVKRLSKAYMHETEFHREVECLMRVRHKNVVRFLGYCADTQGSMERYNGKLVMADVQQRLFCFEYIPKGSLDKYIIDAYREWGTCYKRIKGICEGLQYLHDNHIIHLDLKPANILLDDNMVPKITDFGLSRCYDENQSRDITKTILGTMGYLAPEFREGGVIARSADLYSLGVIIIEILTGQKGYQAIGDVLESWSDRLERSQRDTLCEQIRVCYETALECRDFNPKKRPASARDIIYRLHEMKSIQENFDDARTNAHGENWEEEHLELDAKIIYEAASRMPHGRLGIADELFSKTEKSHPKRSSREDRLERENNRLQRENKRYRGIEPVMRSLAEKGGVDFDGLMQSAAPDLATSDSEVGFERGRDVVRQHETEKGMGGNTGGTPRRENDRDINDDEDDIYEGDDDGCWDERDDIYGEGDDDGCWDERDDIYGDDDVYWDNVHDWAKPY